MARYGFNIFHQLQTRIPVLSLIIAINAFVTQNSINKAYDDAFITYRYAYNLVNGNGFVYNQGERILSTSAPLYGLLLAALGLLTGPDAIPILSGLVSGVSLAATCFILYSFAQLHGHRFCGLVSALLLVSSTLVPFFFGGEMPFLIALVMGAFLAYDRGKTILCSVLMAAAVLTRIDALIAAFVLFAHHIIIVRRFPKRESVCFILLILPFIIFSLSYYGSPLPFSISAKLAQRETGLWTSFATGLFEWTPALLFTIREDMFGPIMIAKAAVISVLTAIGVPALLLKYRFWSLPLMWIVLHYILYSVIGMPFYHWYAAPIFLGVALLLACTLDAWIDLLAKFLATHRINFSYANEVGIKLQGLCLLGILAFTIHSLSEVVAIAKPAPVDLLYKRAGEWIKSSTASDVSIAYVEIGRIGYYSHRKIIDPLGLLDADSLENFRNHLRPGNSHHAKADYIIYNSAFSRLLDANFNRSLSSNHYDLVAELNEPGYPHVLSIYKKSTTKTIPANLEP